MNVDMMMDPRRRRTQRRTMWVQVKPTVQKVNTPATPPAEKKEVQR